MQVNSAILCDFAEVRENLLFVVAGGVTRLWRTDHPAAMGVCLALVLELHRMERDRPHELEVDVIDADGATVAKIQGGFQQATGPDTEVTETTFFPFTFDLRAVGILHPGWHSIEISVDGHHERSLRFRVGPPPGQTPQELPGPSKP